PSPPAIYTLSLHDALPIYSSSPPTKSSRSRGKPSPRSGSSHPLLAFTTAEIPVASALPWLSQPARAKISAVVHAAHDRVANCARDRKSTRLNSSHVKISYA